MREYLKPALKYLTKRVPHPSAIRAYMVQHRAFTYAAVAGLLVIITSTMLIARQIMVADAKLTDAVENDDHTTSLNIAAESEPQSIAGAHSSQQVTSTVSPNGETSASVAVNGKEVKLPQNGTVEKTIRTENGTTKLNVKVNRDSTASNSSSVSTNLNVTTHSTHFDHDTNHRSEHSTP